MKSEIKWMIGIGVALFGIMVTAGLFDNPNIIPVRQFGSDYTCPNILSYSFEITFSNEGTADASLCVSLNSSDENVTFTKKQDCLYSSAEKQTSFKLMINESSISKINNLTINYNYFYKRLFFTQKHTTSCFYDKKNYWENLKLRSEKIIN